MQTFILPLFWGVHKNRDCCRITAAKLTFPFSCWCKQQLDPCLSELWAECSSVPLHCYFWCFDEELIGWLRLGAWSNLRVNQLLLYKPPRAFVYTCWFIARSIIFAHDGDLIANKEVCVCVYVWQTSYILRKRDFIFRGDNSLVYQFLGFVWNPIMFRIRIENRCMCLEWFAFAHDQ